MNYNISINQRAISALNQDLEILGKHQLDLKDVTILDWLLKFHAEPKSKKRMIGEQLYFWGAYGYILQENPLLQIRQKKTVSKRIDKLIAAGLILKYVDQMDGNLTYFSITQKCFDLIKRSPLEGVWTENGKGRDSERQRVGTQNGNNNNTIDYININITPEQAGKKIHENKILLESIAMKNKCSVDQVKGEIPMYVQDLKMRGTVLNNQKHLTHSFELYFSNHFQQELIKSQARWLVDVFNQIANTQFICTEQIIQLWRAHASSNLTKDQIVKAIKNLRSSDDRNWHKEKGYVHATPVHLLKDDNFNKYLNQKF